MRIRFSVSAHKFSDFWLLKTYYENLNGNDSCMMKDALDIPAEFATSDYEIEHFGKAIDLVADDIVHNFINQRSAFDSRQQMQGDHSYLIYRPKTNSDEAEFIVKVNALNNMIFDI